VAEVAHSHASVNDNGMRRPPVEDCVKMNSIQGVAARATGQVNCPFGTNGRATTSDPGTGGLRPAATMADGDCRVYPPMLATRLEDPRRLADPRCIAEPKLDGQRAQLHHEQGGNQAQSDGLAVWRRGVTDVEASGRIPRSCVQQRRMCSAGEVPPGQEPDAP
jgi:hypothetical protein